MKDFNIMIIFDLIIAALGIYLLYSAHRMKKTNQVPAAFIAEEEVKRCEDPKGFSSFMRPRTLLFGITSLASGILCFFADIKVLPLDKKSGNIFGIVMLLIFLAAWLFYSVSLRQARQKYFKPDIYI